MGRDPFRRRKRDDWGRRPKDPFLIWLHADPKRAARLSVLITVGLILFTISVVIGLFVFLVVSLT